MKSAMKHSFSNIPKMNVPRSAFNRSHSYKTTFDAGYLIPFYVDDALPGDTFNVNATLFARLATPIVPVMDNMMLETFFFAVPSRLLWSNWRKFMGERYNPDDSIDFTIPQVEADTGGFPVGGLADYFGAPTEVDNLSISALWHRAYVLIWNEWFRDQNLQDKEYLGWGDGPDNDEDYTGLLRRGKRHDYFTSCLPWPQKGPGVELPLGDYAPVIGIGKATQTFNLSSVTAYESDVSSRVYASADNFAGTSGSNLWYGEESTTDAGYPFIRADLSNATASTINSLRQAFQLQKMYERDARSGTRYIEIIKAHFGVDSDDARQQRPEYLGGSSAPVLIQAVQQTSETGTTPQGNLAAFGTVVANRHGFVKSFTEHCQIIGLLCVRADLTYQQGIPRMFLRSTRYDYYWPALAHLGEQEVTNKEIYAQGDANDDLVFGYQERYAEYRYYPSKITGKLRSTYATSLDIWHLSEEFGSLPTLDSTFIQCDPPIDRIVAVADEPHFILDSYISMKTVRPMPVYSVPGQIDHF